MYFGQTLFGECVFFDKRNAADKNFRLCLELKFDIIGHIYLFTDLIVLTCGCWQCILYISGAPYYLRSFSNNKIKLDIYPLVGILLITTFFHGDSENNTAKIFFWESVLYFIAKLIIFPLYSKSIDCNGRPR